MDNQKHRDEMPTASQGISVGKSGRGAGDACSFSVQTGQITTASGYKRQFDEYEWVGTDDNLKYICPNCHRPVHPGAGRRYYCDPCDESWYFESDLDMNMSSGGWVFKRKYEKEHPVKNHR